MQGKERQRAYHETAPLRRSAEVSSALDMRKSKRLATSKAGYKPALRGSVRQRQRRDLIPAWDNVPGSQTQTRQGLNARASNLILD